MLPYLITWEITIYYWKETDSPQTWADPQVLYPPQNLHIPAHTKIASLEDVVSTF